MMAEPKPIINSNLLFIQNGKLTQQPSSLTGSFHLKDSTNLATIMGKFQNGICESADIYRNQKNKISNIQVQIKEDGSIKMGGSKVKEEIYRLIYEGGYSGYCRNGYGQQYLSDREVRSGVWRLGKKFGQFVEQYRDHDAYKAFVLYYREQPKIEKEIMEIEITQISVFKCKLIYKEDNIEKINGQITRQQAQIWKDKIASKRKELQQHSHLQLIAPLTRESSSKAQKLQLKQLHEKNMLTFDQCQAYLQYLFHSQSYQSFQPTAILSIHTSNYIDKIFNISKNYEPQIKNYKKVNQDLRKQVVHIMHQFKYQYRLFRGFWKHIIIPLSQFDLYKHFSFIRITIHHDRLQCVYYDSMPHSKYIEKMKAHYLEIAKKVLINELIKDTRDNIKKMIQEMTLTVFQEFPIQESSDKSSCGFFILQGIADLMKYGKIKFVSKDLPMIKDQILSKLKDMKNLNDSVL